MDRVLFRNQYLAVIDRDGYTFTREVRCDGVVVAILPFRRSGEELEFLARVEVCPAHGPAPERCSITGGLEPGQSVVEAAQQEVWEEAGYVVDTYELLSLGQVRPSKSADTCVHLFAVDVTAKPQHAPPGDGSSLEKHASVEWVTYKQGIHIADPLFVTALTRLHWLKTQRQPG
jgi:8-oxo-dGTP pyrophosphatase MutT (NUDIX family)